MVELVMRKTFWGIFELVHFKIVIIHLAFDATAFIWVEDLTLELVMTPT